jgi:HD-like signal output (HDOD) protein
MPTELVGMKELLNSRIKDLDKLPTASNILRPLLHYLEDPGDQVEIPKVVDLVSCDNSMTAQCLRMANSPLFGRSREVETVRGAIVALGMRRLREILLSCVLVRLSPNGKQALDFTSYWQHSLCCGLVSRQFAKKIHFQATEKAYMAGLLHDVGILVNSHLMPEEFGLAMDLATSQKISVEEAELAIFGFTHAYSGELLASQWRFPEATRQVILYHHDPEQAKLYPSLVAIVGLSDSFCRMRGMDYGPYDPSNWALVDDPAWAILIREYPYLQELDLPNFIMEVDEYVEVARQMVASILA